MRRSTPMLPRVRLKNRLSRLCWLIDGTNKGKSQTFSQRPFQMNKEVIKVYLNLLMAGRTSRSRPNLTLLAGGGLARQYSWI